MKIVKYYDEFIKSEFMFREFDIILSSLFLLKFISICNICLILHERRNTKILKIFSPLFLEKKVPLKVIFKKNFYFGQMTEK